MPKLSLEEFQEDVRAAHRTVGRRIADFAPKDDYMDLKIALESSRYGARALFTVARIAHAFDDFPHWVPMFTVVSDRDDDPNGDEDGPRLNAVFTDGSWGFEGAVQFERAVEAGPHYLGARFFEALGLPIFPTGRKMLREALGTPSMPSKEDMEAICSTLPRHSLPALLMSPELAFPEQWKVDYQTRVEQNIQWIALLASLGVDIDEPLHGRGTPLMEAAPINEHLFKALLASGADPTVCHADSGPLDLAIALDHSDDDDDSILHAVLAAFKERGIVPTTADGRNFMRHLLDRREDDPVPSFVRLTLMVFENSRISPFAKDKDGLDFDGAFVERRQMLTAPGRTVNLVASTMLPAIETKVSRLWRSTT